MSVYNSESVDENAGAFTLLPNGTYKTRIAGLIFEETKAKQQGAATKGTMITTKLEIVGGPENGRTLFHRFNIENDNEKAQNIGRADFKTFHKACGVQSLTLNSDNDLRVLENRLVICEIEAEGKYNRVKSKSWRVPNTPATDTFSTRSETKIQDLNNIPF